MSSQNNPLIIQLKPYQSGQTEVPGITVTQGEINRNETDSAFERRAFDAIHAYITAHPQD